MNRLSGAVDSDGEAVLGVALDVGHEPEQLEVAKQGLVLAGVIAKGGQNKFARSVEHALGLREVLAVHKGFGCGRVEAGHDLVLAKVGVEAAVDLGSVDVSAEFSRQVSGDLFNNLRPDCGTRW